MNVFDRWPSRRDILRQLGIAGCGAVAGLGFGAAGGRLAGPKRFRGPRPAAPGPSGKSLVLRRAAGGEDESRADEQFVERLLALKEDWNPQGKLLLLAFD